MCCLVNIASVSSQRGKSETNYSTEMKNRMTETVLSREFQLDLFTWCLRQRSCHSSEHWRHTLNKDPYIIISSCLSSSSFSPSSSPPFLLLLPSVKNQFHLVSGCADLRPLTCFHCRIRAGVFSLRTNPPFSCQFLLLGQFSCYFVLIPEFRQCWFFFFIFFFVVFLNFLFYFLRQVV